MRYKAESIVNGKVVSDAADYLDSEELKDLSPEAYQAIQAEAACVGAFLKHGDGKGTLITDRDRFPESGQMPELQKVRASADEVDNPSADPNQTIAVNKS